MLATVTVLILLSQLPCEVELTLRKCEPNKQFFVDGLSCVCDSSGRWQESDCRAVQRGQHCQPGGGTQIGCIQCVCQTNGHLACDDRHCNEETATKNARRGLYVIGQWCTPFKPYYVNCSVCVCSASGKTSDAQCVRDTSCLFNESIANIASGERNICLPKVTYLFPCLHCTCSDHGHFEINKCVETCQNEPLKLMAKCKPRKLYRKECNLCVCPNNGIENHLLCSKNSCANVVRSKSFRSLQKKNEKCLIYSFTNKRCIYCQCTADGEIDEDTCIEAECLKHSAVNYSMSKTSCTAGEMVPLCSECFCLSNRTTNENYCTRSCSYQSKLSIIEKVLQDSTEDNTLFNRDIVIKLTNRSCHANQIYLKDEEYCLCDDNGVINEQLCTNQKQRVNLQAGLDNRQVYNFNITCEPRTFVEFDCNTCFCSKNGTLDPKWCTYDDCKSKKLIQELHKANMETPLRSFNNTCSPGTISNEDCNFCICSETGLVRDRSCTKNRCSDVESAGLSVDKFSCEPLSYYTVDCNICYCPREGLKNVSNCTKNSCEKNFLRSNVCVPGQLFSDKCNVCICPLNGDKNDKACTKNACPEIAWKKVLEISSPISNQLVDDMRIRSLDHCFPGEEFFIGCKLCVCPDMGLRSYAICNQMLCGEEHVLEGDVKLTVDGGQTRRHDHYHNSSHHEMLDLPKNPPCTKDTTYIVNCKQCLCPGDDESIHNFCRPLPMGFRCNKTNATLSASSSQRHQLNSEHANKPGKNLIDLPHTTFLCPEPGRVMDECFICDCEEKNKVILLEHCFKNKAKKCETALATFLVATNKNLQV